MAYPYNPYQPYQQYQQTYPQNYQPNIGQTMQTPQPLQTAPQVQPVQPQIQNGGFVSVRNIEEARNWPVAPGNSVTFKDENSPYVYTKTMGFSSLDRPVFDRYRLVKEDDVQTVQEAQTATENVQIQNPTNYALREEIEPIRQEFEVLKSEVMSIKEQIAEIGTKKPTARPKKEEKDGEE